MLPTKVILTCFTEENNVNVARKLIDQNVIDELHIWDYSSSSTASNELNFPTCEGNAYIQHAMSGYRFANTKLTVRNDECVQVDVKASKDAYFLIKSKNTESIFEVCLGGWNNSRSVIRSSLQGTPCTVYDGQVLDSEDFVPILVYVTYKHVMVIHNQNIVLSAPLETVYDVFEIHVGAWHDTEVLWRFVDPFDYGCATAARKDEPSPIKVMKPSLSRLNHSIKLDYYKHYTSSRYPNHIIMQCKEDLNGINIDNLAKFIQTRLADTVSPLLFADLHSVFTDEHNIAPLSHETRCELGLFAISTPFLYFFQLIKFNDKTDLTQTLPLLTCTQNAKVSMAARPNQRSNKITNNYSQHMSLNDLWAYTQTSPIRESAWIEIRDFVPTVKQAWTTCISDRLEHTMKFLKELYSKRDLYDPPKDVDMFLFVDDNPPPNINPMFAYSIPPSSDIFCIPSFCVKGWPTLPEICAWDEWSKKWLEMYDTPFEDRQDVLFWIGGSTPYREDIVRKARELEYTDFKFYIKEVPYQSMIHQNNYKYIADLQGIGWSARLSHLLWMGAVVFVFDREPHEYWFRGNFEPWVHYVPVKHDGSDLKDVLNVVMNMPDKGKHIADACREKAREIITEEKAHSYTAQLLTKYVEKYGLLHN